MGDGLGDFDLFSAEYDYLESGQRLIESFQLALGKLTLDQQNDVVVACPSGRVPGGGSLDSHGGIAVLKGKTDGTFWDPRRLFAVAPLSQQPCPRFPKPCFVQIVDMNNDGKNDVITSNGDDGTFSVLLNATLPDDN